MCFTWEYDYNSAKRDRGDPKERQRDTGIHFSLPHSRLLLIVELLQTCQYVLFDPSDGGKIEHIIIGL